MGRARSRRSRGKSGGQGAGKGKGTGTGKGAGSGKGTGGSKGRSNANRNTKKNRLKVKSEKVNSKFKTQVSKFNKRVQDLSTPESKKDRRYERIKKQFGLDYNDMKEGPTIKINPKQWLGGFTEKTGIPTGFISNRIPERLSGNWINHTLRSPNKLRVHPSDSRWGGGVAKDLLLATQAKQAQKAQQKAETKALDTQYKQDQAIYNNNKKNMSVTIGPSTGSGSGPQQSDEEFLSGAYNKVFGRDFSKSKGGGQYWLDQMKANPNTHSRDEVMRMLQGSDEGKKYAASGKVQIGGIDPTKSISSQAGEGTWASHFAPGGVYENQNAASAATQIAKDVGHTPSEAYFNTGVTDQTGADKTGTTISKDISDGWWNQFADADAFKKFLQPDAAEAKQDGMGDFMKFMMLMNVMGGGRGGGGGYGGSQFGYGGMSPGGVQAAYDPMKQLQGMGTWFKDNFGSGSTSTGNINAT